MKVATHATFCVQSCIKKIAHADQTGLDRADAGDVVAKITG